MLYDLTTHDDKKLSNNLENTFKEYVDFFELEMKDFRPIIFFMDREIFKMFAGNPPESVVAFAKTKTNLIFSCKQEDIKNIYDEENYKKLLKHEAVHIFLSMFLNMNNNVPLWLHEGLARYLSGQLGERVTCKGIEKLFTNEASIWLQYDGGGCFIKYLVEKYSKEKFLEFLKSLRNNTSKNDAYDKFKKIYEEDIQTVLNEIVK